MNRFILCFLGLLWQTALAQPVATYPLKVSENGCCFVGQNGQPVLYTVFVGGYGQYMRDTYVVAAVSEDKTRLIAYLPHPGMVTVDLGQRKSGILTVRWFRTAHGAVWQNRIAGRKIGLETL